MKYRYFEKTLGDKGKWLAVEGKFIKPITYREVLDADGNCVFEGQMNKDNLDDPYGEGLEINEELVILTGSVPYCRYFEITDENYRPYVDQRLSQELPKKYEGIPLLVKIIDYPGISEIAIAEFLGDFQIKENDLYIFQNK